MRVPKPALKRPPLEGRAFAKVTVFPFVSMRTLELPEAANREDRSVVMPVAYWSPPPLNVIVPVPRPPFVELPTPMEPASKAMEPDKVLAPERVKTPVPALMREPAPERTPL
jgi:hypothetical protein